MPLDGLTLGFVTGELDAKLTGGRIDRVTQPERDELILTIRNGGENHLLLLSASADCARAHLTAQKKTGPLEPPSLCMLLRKHVTGGRVSAIRQIDCDRILEIEIEHYDELGDRATKRLVCEFMGKHSNLIFVGGDGRIIDSARRVTDTMSSVREVLPGLRYERPPAHGKIPFAEVTPEDLAAAIRGQGGALWKAVARSVSGISAQTARELAHRATGDAEARLDACDPDAAAKAVADALAGLKGELSPACFETPTRRRRTLPPSPSKPARPRARAVSDALRGHGRLLPRPRRRRPHPPEERRHPPRAQDERRALRAQAGAAAGGAARQRAHGRIPLKGRAVDRQPAHGPEGHEAGRAAELLRRRHAHGGGRAGREALAGQNAQRYFKLYQKARNARTLAAEQIEKTSAELDYLNGQLDNLGKCETEAELNELRQELEKLGYVKPNRNRRQLKQLPPSQPMRFTAASGRTILVGKNNLQNDKLTFTAQPDEVWLHAKDMPGSHVVIVGEAPDEETILEAAGWRRRIRPDQRRRACRWTTRCANTSRSPRARGRDS